MSAIIHLAAVFRTPDTDLIWKSNLEGARNLISAVKGHAPSARFILASTSNVYGATGAHPGREDDDVAPQQAYPASKVAAELALRESGLTLGCAAVSFRLRGGGWASGSATEVCQGLPLAPRHADEYHPSS